MFLIDFFFNFIIQHSVSWELDNLLIYFDLLYMGFSWSYDLGCEFGRLTLVDLSYFLDLLFLIDYFLISSFNIDVAHHSDPPSFLKSRGEDFFYA
jgi:hypothetical protein